MKITIDQGLPFLSIEVSYEDKKLEIPRVLLDTGSASTIVSADVLTEINLVPQPDDALQTVIGIGGTEVVFTRTIDFLEVDRYKANDFLIEVGGMDYDFDINGILGMDFLLIAEVLIDLSKMELAFEK